MKADNPDYSVIIPAYNEEKYIAETLSCINNITEKISDYTGEIIVTDNRSTDTTAHVARSHGAIVVFERKRQIAKARNTGAKASCGRFLIFVDADTLINQELLEETLRCLISGEYCGGGATITLNEHPPVAARVLFSMWNLFSRKFGCAAGSYVFCSREAFENVGGFDETYFAGEELYLSIALKKFGKFRNMKFGIIDRPVITSDRKFKWFSYWQLLRQVLPFIIKPSQLKRQRACNIWYTRPKSSKTEK